MIRREYILSFCLLLLGLGICRADDSDRGGNNYNLDSFIIPMAVYASSQSAMQAYDSLNKIKTNFSASLPQNLPRMPNLSSPAPLPGIISSGILSPVNQADFQDYLQKLERNNEKLQEDILLSTKSNLAANNQMPAEQTSAVSDFTAKENK